MVICNYYDNEIHIAWEKVTGAEGYMLYRKTGEHLFTFFKEVKTNTAALFGICDGEEIKIKPFRLENGKKVFDFTSEKLVIGRKNEKDEFEYIINPEKSSANIYWNPIKNAEKYKIYLNGSLCCETLNNEYTVKNIPVGKSNIMLEALKGKKSLKKSDLIPIIIDTIELFAVNYNGKVLLYWNKVPNTDGYRIFKKQSTGEFGGFISTTGEKILVDNIEPGELAEFKVKPYVLKDGQREFSGIAAKRKVNIYETSQIDLTVIEAYGKKSALTWIFDGDVDGYDIYKNNKLIKNIPDGLAHIAFVDYSKAGYTVKGYKKVYDEILYTCKSPPVKMSKISIQQPDSYKLSVIIPAYNSQDYISRTISTVIASTLDDIELVIVDDESKDNTRKIVNWYSKKYPFIVKGIYKNNSGVADTRNTGIDAAKGKYIAFMDNDDMIRPDGFKRLYDAIETTNSDIAVSPIYRIDNDKYIIRHRLPFVGNKAIDIEEYLRLLFSDQFSNVGIWNKLYKSELVKAHPLGIQMYEDVAWTPCILSWADKFCYVDKICYEWDRKIRKTTFSNVLSGRTPEEKFNDRFNAVKFFYENGNPNRRECLAYLMAKRLYGQGLKAKYSKYFKVISDMKEELINNKFLLNDKEAYDKIFPLLEN